MLRNRVRVKKEKTGTEHVNGASVIDANTSQQPSSSLGLKKKHHYFLEFSEGGKVHRLQPNEVPLHFLVMKDGTFLHQVKPKQKVLPGLQNLDLIMDPSPYQIADSMMLSKVDLCFRMLKLNQAYVVRGGRLVGLITRSLLIKYLNGRERMPMDRCRLLCETCCYTICCCFRPRRRVDDREEMTPELNSGGRVRTPSFSRPSPRPSLDNSHAV